MISALKAEFAKLTSVRSTYIWTGIMVVITLFLSGYVYGNAQAKQALISTSFMYDAMYFSLGFFGMAATILAILLVTHEYRYKTIDYTLTASRSRLTVFVAKALVMLGYAFVGGVIVSILSYIGLKVGLNLSNTVMIAQEFPVAEVIAKFAVYLLSYTMIGLIFGYIFKSVIIAIVAYFVVPSIEGVVSIVIKTDLPKYLPFRSFDAVAASPTLLANGPEVQVLTQGAAIVTSLIYISVFTVIAALLFIRRDAN